MKKDPSKMNNGRACITVGQARNANTILQGTVKLEDAYEISPIEKPQNITTSQEISSSSGGGTDMTL